MTAIPTAPPTITPGVPQSARVVVDEAAGPAPVPAAGFPVLASRPAAQAP